MLKTSPALGGVKSLTYSEMVFESAYASGILSNMVARIRFRFKANSDIRPNTTVIITMGGLTRRNFPSDLGSLVGFSGKNAPMFAQKGTLGTGWWDPVKSEVRNKRVRTASSSLFHLQLVSSLQHS